MSTHKKTFIDTAQYTCMRKDTTRSPDDLLRDEGNSLQDNYALHDVGEKYLVDAINSLNESRKWGSYHLEPLGLDARDDDTGLTYDDKLDFEIQHRDPMRGSDLIRTTILAQVDVKTKSSKSWLNVTNLRHYAHYVKQQTETHADCYIMMCLLDEDDTAVSNVSFLPVESNDKYQMYEDYFDPEQSSVIEDTTACVDDFENVESTFIAPDNNVVVRLDDSDALTTDTFLSEVCI